VPWQHVEMDANGKQISELCGESPRIEADAELKSMAAELPREPKLIGLELAAEERARELPS
jgi:hypothetical protein